MKRVILALVTPDETFEVQTKIVNELIDNGVIEQREVINVNEDSIELNLDQALVASKVHTKVMKFRPYLNLQQCKFDDGGGVDANTSPSATSGSEENVSTSDQNGEGARSGIVVGVGEGMGNANLKGTTFIAGNDKKRSKINLDEIVHDQSQYTAESYPQITYNEEQSTIYLPATQTSYSVGKMTKSDVSFMNKKFEQQYSVFSSDLDENKGTIVPPVASPDDVKVEHNMEPGAPKPDPQRIVGDSELNDLNNDRSKDARDPDFSPALVNTKAELIAIIRKGQMPNQTQVQEGILPVLHRIEKNTTPKEELIQRMLAFNEKFGIDQMVYSLTDKVANKVVAAGVAAGTRKVVNKGIENATGVQQKGIGNAAGIKTYQAVNKVLK